MGTRSTITARLRDGTYRSVYCHWDGYPEEPGVGWMLRKHYNTQDLAEGLTSLGSLSSLKEGLKHTVAHHRDGKESWADCRPGVGATYMEALTDGGGPQEYDYLWDGTSWHLISDDLRAVAAFVINEGAPS